MFGGDSARDTAHTRTADTLRSAHKKVLRRMAELLDGKTSAMTAIATREGLCSTYVAPFIKLSLSAAGIIAVIVRSRPQETLSLHRLNTGFAPRWKVCAPRTP